MLALMLSGSAVSKETIQVPCNESINLFKLQYPLQPAIEWFTISSCSLYHKALHARLEHPPARQRRVFTQVER